MVLMRSHQVLCSLGRGNTRQQIAFRPQAALDNARLTVFSKPSEGINEQVVFNAEVLISRARLRVDGGTIFRLRSQEQTAWPKSASQDALVVRALKSGLVAVVTARRLNGGATRYVFSLDGDTEAIGNATSRCTI